MAASDILRHKVEQQIGGLTFELLSRDAEIELLTQENTALKAALKNTQAELDKANESAKAHVHAVKETAVDKPYKHKE